MSAKLRGILVAGSALATAVLPGTAVAQSAPEASVEEGRAVAEILVVAQRREQKMQDVPISITALSADSLQSTGVASSADLSQSVAGLNISAQNGSLFPHIRGVGNSNIGPGLENGVAMYVDGVYVGASYASILSLANIAQVEVLKGPQGTLFGRNATGGLIQIITRKPSEAASVEVRASFDTFETLTLDGYLTGGLASGIAMDFAGHYSTQGQGWGKNLANGQDVNKVDDDVALRSSLLFSPSSDTEVRITGDYSKTTGSTFARRPLPGTTPLLPGQPLTSVWDVSVDHGPYLSSEAWGLTGNIEQNLGFAQLTSITAYRDSKTASVGDGDITRIPGVYLDLSQSSKQFSQEVQLSSQPGSSIAWMVGGYYFHESGRFDPARISFFGPARPVAPFGTIAVQTVNAELKTESLAGFGQATFNLAEQTNLTLGFRYTTEKRTIDALTVFTTAAPATVPLPPTTQAMRSSKPTWRIALDHRLSPEVMIYASYNRGFKSGGFNGANPSSPAFVPEVLDAYEAGFKSDLLDRKLRFNASAFYYDYSNIQVSSYPGGVTVIYNGAAARVYGLDVDFEARVTPQFTLSGGIEWIDSKFTNFPTAAYFTPAVGGGNASSVRDGSGNKLPEAPNFVGNIAADYHIPTNFGEVGLTLAYSYNNGYFAQPDNVFAVPSFSNLNGAISFDLQGKFGIQLWGRNLTNAKAIYNLSSNAAVTAAGYRAPRTFGVTVKAKF